MGPDPGQAAEAAQPRDGVGVWLAVWRGGAAVSEARSRYHWPSVGVLAAGCVSSRPAAPLPARLAPAPGTRLRDYCQVRHKLRIEVRNCRRSPLVKYLPTLNYLFEYHITVKKCLSSSSMVENYDYDEKLTWASTYIITYLLHST